MVQLTAEDAAAFFRRSYTAVDGLWFVKAEEELGFDGALKVDNEVWKVMPKIQARLLKTMLGQGTGLEALAEGLTTKLRWEEYVFEATMNEDRTVLTIELRECPWHSLMMRSGRGHLAGRVGAVICASEYAVWAGEFGAHIAFSLEGLMCEGSQTCVLRFTAPVGHETCPCSGSSDEEGFCDPTAQQR